MNKTKRKIFETSMKLFAEKGYDATSIEEITANVGVAKGTLYYHFSSKEEIFQFLIEEGVKLLKNSVEIKTEKLESSIDKIKAVVLIEIKVLVKYEDYTKNVLNIEREQKKPRKDYSCYSDIKNQIFYMYDELYNPTSYEWGKIDDKNEIIKILKHIWKNISMLPIKKHGLTISKT